VAKVKKAAGVTGERNVKPKATTKTATKGKHPKTSKATKRANTASRTKTAKRAKTAKTAKVATKRGAAKKATSKRGGRMTQATAKIGRNGKRSLRLVPRRGPVRADPVVRVAVKPLDPLRKCGPNTSVQFLYRVDETVDGRNTPHLVFFDRHGWYCEHGRTCPAVGHAKKYNGQIARVS